MTQCGIFARKVVRSQPGSRQTLSRLQITCGLLCRANSRYAAALPLSRTLNSQPQVLVKNMDNSLQRDQRPPLWMRAAIRFGDTLSAIQRRISAKILRQVDVQTAARLCNWTYGRTRKYTADRQQAEGLLDFEHAAIQKFFPAVPARILVVGCGGGREMVALRKKGYDIIGCEPALPLVQTARRVCADTPVVHAAAQQLHLHAQCDGPFSAVIMGWGAWGHILPISERLEVLRHLRERCPTGPVLLSWQLLPNAPLRRSEQTAQTDWRQLLSISPRGLVQVILTQEQIRIEAKELGFDVVHAAGYESGYPHAVLMPK